MWLEKFVCLSFFALTFAVLVDRTSAHQPLRRPSNTVDTSGYHRTWSQLENFTRAAMFELAIRYEKEFNFVLVSSDITEQCRRSLVDFLRGLKSMDLESVQSK